MELASYFAPLFGYEATRAKAREERRAAIGQMSGLCVMHAPHRLPPSLRRAMDDSMAAFDAETARNCDAIRADIIAKMEADARHERDTAVEFDNPSARKVHK